MVTGVADGESALRELVRTQYDLLLLDLHLPGMGGAEIVQRCRRLPGPNRAIPIVALTGDVGPEAWALKREAGLRALVEKGLSRAAWRYAADIQCLVGGTGTAGRVAERRGSVAGAGRGTAGGFAGLARSGCNDRAGRGLPARSGPVWRGSCSEPVQPTTGRQWRRIHAIIGLAANYGLMALARRARSASAPEEIAAELARGAEALRCFVRDRLRRSASVVPSMVDAFRDAGTG